MTIVSALCVRVYRFLLETHLLLALGLLAATGLGAYVAGPLLSLPHSAPIRVDAGWGADNPEREDLVAAAPANVSRPAAGPNRAEAARAAFVRAEQSLANKNDDGVKLIREVVRNYADTSWAERAKVRLAEISASSDRTREAQNVYERLKEQVKILNEWGDYSAAEEICARYLTANPPAELVTALAGLKAQIRQEAGRELSQVQNEIKRLAAEGQYDLARRLAYEAQKALAILPGDVVLADEIKTLEQAQQKATEENERDEILRLRDKNLARICELAANGQYEDAKRHAGALATAAKRAKLDEITPLAQALESSVAAEKRLREDLVNRINSAGKKMFVLKLSSTLQGQVISATKDKLRLELTGGNAWTEAEWGSVGAEKLIELAREYLGTGDADDRFALGSMAAHRRMWQEMRIEFGIAVKLKPALGDTVQQFAKLAEILKDGPGD